MKMFRDRFRRAISHIYLLDEVAVITGCLETRVLPWNELIWSGLSVDRRSKAHSDRWSKWESFFKIFRLSPLSWLARPIHSWYSSCCCLDDLPLFLYLIPFATESVSVLPDWLQRLSRSIDNYSFCVCLSVCLTDCRSSCGTAGFTLKRI